MKYGIASAIVLSLTLVTLSLAGDWDEEAHKMLSTLKPDQKYEELGLIVFYQKKETAPFGSDAKATLEEAVKTLEENAQKIGADRVIGVNFAWQGSGDVGLAVWGTAIKLAKQ